MILPAVFALVAVGAVAACLLLGLRRILPNPAVWALGLVAIAAGFATIPAALTLLPAMVPMIEKLVVLPVRSEVARIIVPVVSLPGKFLGWPAAFLSSQLFPVSPLVSNLVYSASWALLQMLAVSAVASMVPPLPLPRPLAHARAALSRPWPTGIRAAIATIVAALVMAALPRVLAHVLGPGEISALLVLLGVGLLPFAAIVVLRCLLPNVISQGAWTIVIGVTPVLMMQMALIRFGLLGRLPGGRAHLDYYLVALAVLSAAILMIGPRLRLRSNSIAWVAGIVCLVMVVLPGFGWLVLRNWTS
jgi:hypothetical protein